MTRHWILKGASALALTLFGFGAYASLPGATPDAEAVGIVIERGIDTSPSGERG